MAPPNPALFISNLFTSSAVYPIHPTNYRRQIFNSTARSFSTVKWRSTRTKKRSGNVQNTLPSVAGPESARPASRTVSAPSVPTAPPRAPAPAAPPPRRPRLPPPPLPLPSLSSQPLEAGASPRSGRSVRWDACRTSSTASQPSAARGPSRSRSSAPGSLTAASRRIRGSRRSGRCSRRTGGGSAKTREKTENRTGTERRRWRIIIT